MPLLFFLLPVQSYSEINVSRAFCSFGRSTLFLKKIKICISFFAMESASKEGRYFVIDDCSIASLFSCRLLRLHLSWPSEIQFFYFKEQNKWLAQVGYEKGSVTIQKKRELPVS